MKIVVDRAIPFVVHFFSTIGDVVPCDGREITRSDLLDADVLIVRTATRVNRDLLGGTRVRFVATATSGHDHVDTQYLQDNGIYFAHAAGCNARSVAEYVLSSLFVLADQKKMDLTEQSVGIIGCGHVGTTLYQFLQILGIRCLLNDPPLQQRSSPHPFHRVEKVLGADIISLHVPLVKTGPYPTRHLLDRERMAGISQRAILINTSRGGVIDEAALDDFIDTAPHCSVVLDVWENEPDINHGLLQKVAISTPHIAGYSTDAKLSGTWTVFKQACRFLDKPLNNSRLPTLPEPELIRIDLAEYDKPVDAIQMAVLASYDVRTDSSPLRQMLDVSPDSRGAYFSDLRNNYPVRREFTAMTVSLAGRSGGIQEKLMKLGFKVEQQSGQ